MQNLCNFKNPAARPLLSALLGALFSGCLYVPDKKPVIPGYTVRPVPKSGTVAKESYIVAWGPKGDSLELMVKNIGDTVISLDLENSVLLSIDSTVSPWPHSREIVKWTLSTPNYSVSTAVASNAYASVLVTSVSSGPTVSASVEARPWVKVKIPPKGKWVASPLKYESWRCGSQELEKLKAFWKDKVLNGVTLKLGEEYENFWVRTDSLEAKPIVRWVEVRRFDKKGTLMIWGIIGAFVLALVLLKRSN